MFRRLGTVEVTGSEPRTRKSEVDLPVDGGLGEALRAAAAGDVNA